MMAAAASLLLRAGKNGWRLKRSAEEPELESASRLRAPGATPQHFDRGIFVA